MSEPLLQDRAKPIESKSIDLRRAKANGGVRKARILENRMLAKINATTQKTKDNTVSGRGAPLSCFSLLLYMFVASTLVSTLVHKMLAWSTEYQSADIPCSIMSQLQA